MRFFATGLIAASAQAVQLIESPYALPQYSDRWGYDPAYDTVSSQYSDYKDYVEYPKALYPSATEYPVLDHTIKLAEAWASPYYYYPETK